MTKNRITSQIIGAAIELHRHLGPGLLKSTYRQCLYHELRSRGIKVIKEVPLPIVYKGEKIEAGYCIDLLVEEKLIVGVKTAETLADIDFTQLLTYLKFEDKKLGLLINFNTLLLKNGIKRVLNGNI